jgi:enamine deaminase RidA (YjgF/YER057c/UK114 family)
MATYFKGPYPARAAIGVASLPRGSLIEIDAIMHFDTPADPGSGG